MPPLQSPVLSESRSLGHHTFISTHPGFDLMVPLPLHCFKNLHDVLDGYMPQDQSHGSDDLRHGAILEVLDAPGERHETVLQARASQSPSIILPSSSLRRVPSSNYTSEFPSTQRVHNRSGAMVAFGCRAMAANRSGAWPHLSQIWRFGALPWLRTLIATPPVAMAEGSTSDFVGVSSRWLQALVNH
ncbi:hypothetical protein NL676_021464 [Syzygium grande]|nr:hypothetical protein NL676_021464 [Syzygium grande]